MAAALNFVKDFLLSILMMLSMVFTPYSAEPYEAKDPENAELVFNVISDVHVETNNTASYSNFKQVLYGVKANKSAKATVLLGDNTMNGQGTESFLLFGGLSALVNSENTFLILGNHDIGNGEGDYDEFFARFTSYNNFFLKNKIDNPYYYRVVDGHYMIFLAPETLCVHSFYMSDEQIEWLKETLELAKASGNPIFVFSHHPLTYLENDNSNLLVDILSGYDNVFHLHGHTHWSYYTYKNGNVTCANLPRVTETEDYAPGTGVVVEVYENEVILRERDFYSGEWLGETAFSLLNEEIEAPEVAA